MAITPFKTFIVGEILTASDLNSSFTRITDNGEDVPFPSTKAVDFNGQRLILDADGDTSITADTDDQIDIELAGADDFRFVVNSFLVLSGSNIDLDGNELILDADGDTSITADVDDTIDIRIGGFDDFQFTPDTFSILSGSSIDLNGVGTILFDADGDLILSSPADDIMQLGLVSAGNTGPVFRFFHDSSSPAVGDIIGGLEFQGKSSTGVNRIYSSFAGRFSDATNLSEDGELIGLALVGGTNRTIVRFREYSIGQQFEAGTLFWQGPSATGLYEWSTGADPGTTGAMALDSSGRLLIGDTASRLILGQNVSFQVTGTSTADSSMALQRFSPDSGQPFILFGKSRGASPGIYTIVNDNDVAGDIRTFAADGIDMGTAICRLHFEVDDVAPAASSIGGAIVFSVAAGLAADDLVEVGRFGADGIFLVGGIDVRRVATAAVNGIVELATPAEADAGVDTTRAVVATGLEESRKRMRATSTTATTSETLVPATHAGTTRRYTAATTVTVTVDTGWTDGDWVILIQDGAGQVQLAEGTATIAKPSDRNRNTRAQESIICLIFSATATSHVGGDLEVT